MGTEQVRLTDKPEWQKEVEGPPFPSAPTESSSPPQTRLWAVLNKRKQEIKWAMCLRGGALSQVRSASSGRDMQACFCVCTLRFHTLTQARTHMHWPIVSVFIWTLSDSLEYLTATRIRFWPTDALHAQQTVEETMQSHPVRQIWDRPLPSHQAGKATDSSHLCCSVVAVTCCM